MSWPLVGDVSKKKWGCATRRLMALTLASRANDDGSGIFASVKTMARDSEISESTARRTLQTFEEEGIITKVGERPCLNGYTNIYTMNVEAVSKLDDLKPDRGVTTTVVSRRDPVSSRHQTGVTAPYKPIQEPKSLTGAREEFDFGEASIAAPIQRYAKSEMRIQLSEGSGVSVVGRNYAHGKGFVNGSVDVMFEDFVDYQHRENKTYFDMEAAWRWWVRKRVEFNTRDEHERRNAKGAGASGAGRSSLAFEAATRRGGRGSGGLAGAAVRARARREAQSNAEPQRAAVLLIGGPS